jgi:hypothetical protein
MPALAQPQDAPAGGAPGNANLPIGASRFQPRIPLNVRRKFASVV